jgi:hypothetical protein
MILIEALPIEKENADARNVVTHACNVLTHVAAWIPQQAEESARSHSKNPLGDLEKTTSSRS